MLYEKGILFDEISYTMYGLSDNDHIELYSTNEEKPADNRHLIEDSKLVPHDFSAPLSLLKAPKEKPDATVQIANKRVAMPLRLQKNKPNFQFKKGIPRYMAGEKVEEEGEHETTDEEGDEGGKNLINYLTTGG